MPKVNVLPNSNNQLPPVQARTVKVTTQANPHNPTVNAQRGPESTEGQSNKTEDTATEATQQPIDPKFEALAKKESAFRTREKEFQAREADFKAKQAELDQAKSFKDRLKSNPLEVLNELGVTYDDLVAQAINAPDQNTVEIRNELKALRDKQTQIEENAKNSANAQREAAITQIRHDVTDLVKSDPSFETIHATESAEDVVELITRTFDESGKLLSVDEAARMVEEELFQEAMKIAQIGKVKAKLQPEPAPETKQELKSQRQIQTLTNNMSSSKPMSARDRAIARFKGEKF